MKSLKNTLTAFSALPYPDALPPIPPHELPDLA